MLDDRLLIWRFNRGNMDVLRYVYKRQKDYLVTLAAALLHDRNAAEDVVHDVFVSFIQMAGRFRLTGSLKGYLSTCVANNARNRNKAKQEHSNTTLAEAGSITTDVNNPRDFAIFLWLRPWLCW